VNSGTVSLDSTIRDCNFERTISERLSESETGFCDSVKGIGGNDQERTIVRERWRVREETIVSDEIDRDGRSSENDSE
jgi:phosphomevalonate kinase